MLDNTIEKYFNNHEGKRCFILGSGPSIKNQDLSILKNEITFCSNWFINHKIFSQLNINYYCAYDDNFVIPEPNPIWIERLSNFRIVKYFPMGWKDLNIPLDAGCFIKFNREIKLFERGTFSIDPINIGFNDGGSVIINFCIPLAIYMGINKIFLLGCDSVYAIKNNDCSNAYFYNIQEHHTTTNHTEFTEKVWQTNLFKSYLIVKNYCDKNGINIVNCTKGGELNIFPRADLYKIIN